MNVDQFVKNYVQKQANREDGVPPSLKDLPPDRWIFGLDLGKRIDRTALAVLRVYYTQEEPGKQKQRYQIGHLRTWPRQTSYHQICQDLLVYKQYPEYEKVVVCYDMTGLGTVFEELLQEYNIECYGVTITGGKIEHTDGASGSVPKATLIAGMQIKLETGVLTLHANMKMKGVFRRQVAAFKAKYSDKGNVTFGGRGEHDDLISAVALALWGEKFTSLQVFIG